MAEKRTISWENFVEIHYRQLLSIGLPESLWKILYSKLAPVQIRDAGTAFELHEDGRRFTLHAKERLEKDQDVFLVDHAWTSDGAEKAKKMLTKKPELLKRMKEMMCLDEDEEEDEVETIPQEGVVQQIAGVDEEKAKECLEKMKNDLIQATILAEGGDKQKPDINLDQFDDNKSMTLQEFKDGFMASVDEDTKKLLSDEFMEKMYKKYLKDAEVSKTEVRYGEATTPKYSWSETDEGDGSITVVVSVPSDTPKKAVESKVTPKHWTLKAKDGQTIIDGDFYSRVQPDECFWTFDGPGVVQMTLQKTDPSEGLWPCLIKGETHLDAQQIYDDVIEKKHKERQETNFILENMWKFNQTYQAVMVKGGPQEHMWYVMDEVGSALTHSNTPNMKCSPFAYAVNNVIYSLMWPTANIEKGEVCTRDFCPPLVSGEMPMQKEARLLACMPEIPDEYPRSFLQDYAIAVSSGNAGMKVQAKMEPLQAEEAHTPLPGLSLKFYVDSKDEKIKSILSSMNCSFTDKPEHAEAIWVDKPLDNVEGGKMINFLSGDDFLTRRDVLSRMLVKKLGKVSWIPQSFNLRSQLAAFCVEHYMRGMSAMWIVRAANPSEFHFRPVMSSDLRRIIRLGETGPLVASEYIMAGTLSQRKHFVLQYSVILHSLKPLVLLIHNTPNIRKSAQPYDSMGPIDEYNPDVFLTLKENVKQDEEPFQEFVKNFEKHYTPRCKQTWSQVQNTVYTCILELFLTISPSLSIPGKICSGQIHEKLSAVYGVDVIVMEDMSVAIIGVDATPTFPDDQVAKEVLYAMYADKDSFRLAGRNVTMVTCDE